MRRGAVDSHAGRLSVGLPRPELVLVPLPVEYEGTDSGPVPCVCVIGLVGVGATKRILEVAPHDSVVEHLDADE